jgi:hypothetical protein
MSDEGYPPRLYGEKEVGALLKRATELQEDESVASARVSGLTLRDLEEIAAEAGIDPRYLRLAATEMDAEPDASSAWTWATGAPVTLLYERTIRGEIPDDRFEHVVELIQQLTGAAGQPSLVGRTLTWRFDTPSKMRTLHILVSSRDGETRIRIVERLHQLAGSLFGGIMGGGGMGVGLGVGLGVGIDVLGSVLFSVAFPVGVIGLSYAVARSIFAARSRSRQRALARILDRLTRAVGEMAGPDSVAPPPSRAELPPAPKAAGSDVPRL